MVKDVHAGSVERFSDFFCTEVYGTVPRYFPKKMDKVEKFIQIFLCQIKKIHILRVSNKPFDSIHG